MNKEPIHGTTACFMPGGVRWVPIMAIALSEIAAGRFQFPYAWNKSRSHPALLVKVGHIVEHISLSEHLRDEWIGQSVRSASALKKLMDADKVFAGECVRTIDGKRFSDVQIIPLERLASFGLDVEQIRNLQPWSVKAPA